MVSIVQKMPKWGFIFFICFTVSWLISPAQGLNVKYDFGGSIEGRKIEIAKLRAKGDQVRIEGVCLSACTLYLVLPNSCVTQTAYLGFHGPSSPFPGYKLPKEEFDRVSQVMADHYPRRLKNWFMKTARYRISDYYALTGAEVIALGARPC